MSSPYLRLKQQISMVRRQVGVGSPLDFAKTYLTSTCRMGFSSMHLELFQLLAEIERNRGARLAVAAPRGHAKSTIVALAYVLWCALYSKERFIILVSATKPQATTLLSHIKDQVTDNARLLADFPEVCTGPRKPWRDNQIQLGNGVMIRAYGAGQGIRGMRHRDQRPGLIIVDDLEETDTVIVEEQRQKLLAWFSGTLLKAGHPDTNVIVIGTILHHASLLAQLVDEQSRRGWRGRTYKAVIDFSPRADLWEHWSSIYHGRIEHEGHGGEEAALGYFEANREAMLKDTQVLWPELDDYYRLMVMCELEGRASFQAEKQNEPLDPEQCLFAGQHFRYWEDDYRDEQHLLDALGTNARFFGACDPSLGTKQGDFSAIIVLARDRKAKVNYLLAADLKRRSPDETIQAIVRYAQRYNFRKFGVEANHFQKLMIQNLDAKARDVGSRINIEEINSRTNKRSRIASLEPDVTQGHIRFSRRHQLLLNQLRQFPVGKHDDGPDALEMAVELANRKEHIAIIDTM